MWEKKSEQNIVRNLTIHMSFDVKVDSALTDEELPIFFRDQLFELLGNKSLELKVTTISRDAEGVIKSLGLSF